jgi:phage FluMu protein Com
LASRTLTCAQCGTEFEYPVRAGRLPIRCPECRRKEPRWRERENESYTPTSHRFNEADKRMLQIIIDELGMSQSQAIRAAVQVYSALLLKARK